MQSPKPKQPLHPVLTVSQLTGQIKDVVEELFDNVYVVGEVSNAKAYPSGHWYFSLKDKDATLPCVCFKRDNSGIKFKLEDGLMLVAQGSLSIYPPKGGYQLVATALEPVGVGEWQLAFEQLRAALEKEGLLDPARKKPIPTVPRRIGIVTSPAAAALRDILSALSRRNRNVNIVISPARVQGEGSAEEIAQAIRDLQTVPGIEVIIVARGGGSIEDLWSFNTEVVARAVAACPIPIVSGVGHETDTTICDLVADLRAPTPTAAAELVARGSQELLEKYKNLEQKLVFKIDQRISKARRQLERLSPINALTRYQGRLKQYQMRVAHYKISIERSVTHLMRNLQHRLEQKHVKLLALAPTNTLNRGFAILRKLDGTVVCDPSHVQPGEELQAILKTGSLYLNVAAVQESLFAMLDPRSGSEQVALVEVPASTQIDEQILSIEQFVSVEQTVHSETEVRVEQAELKEDFAEVELLASDSQIEEPADALSRQEIMMSAVPEPVLSMAVEAILLEEENGCSLFVSEAVTTVFDTELADPATLATIFGENLADADSASTIFKSGANAHRLEVDALNAELTKDGAPDAVITEKVTPKTIVTASLDSESVFSCDPEKSYPALGDEKSSETDGTLFVKERVPELELASASRSNFATTQASASRQKLTSDKASKRGKVAAHQLNLFNSGDE